MTKVYGYERLVCPNCIPGNRNSKSIGKYKVYETNTHLHLKCAKCGYKMIIEKKYSGKLIEAISI